VLEEGYWPLEVSKCFFIAFYLQFISQIPRLITSSIRAMFLQHGQPQKCIVQPQNCIRGEFEANNSSPRGEFEANDIKS
jgi:hypothetical protein